MKSIKIFFDEDAYDGIKQFAIFDRRSFNKAVRIILNEGVKEEATPTKYDTRKDGFVLPKHLMNKIKKLSVYNSRGVANITQMLLIRAINEMSRKNKI